MHTYTVHGLSMMADYSPQEVKVCSQPGFPLCIYWGAISCGDGGGGPVGI